MIQKQSWIMKSRAAQVIPRSTHRMGLLIRTTPGTTYTEWRVIRRMQRSAVIIDSKEGEWENAFTGLQAILSVVQYLQTIFQSADPAGFLIIPSPFSSLLLTRGGLWDCKLYNKSMMEQQFKNDNHRIESVSFQRPLRVDFIQNKQMLFRLFKIFLAFSLLCAVTKMLPQAKEIQSFTPEVWENSNTLDVRRVTPLNRKIKFYLFPQNQNQKIDDVSEAVAYSLKDEQEFKLRLDVRFDNLNDYQKIDGQIIKYYIGDIHVLDEVAFRIKVLKPKKETNKTRVLQQTLLEEQKPSIDAQKLVKDQSQEQEQEDTITEVAEQQQRLRKQRQEERAEKQKQQWQQAQKALEQQREKAQAKEAQAKGAEKKRKEQEEKQQKLKEQEKKRLKEQEEKRLKEQEEKRLEKEAERQKLEDKTNIRIEAHMMANFSTILELVVNYISILVIIYMATDNPSAPIAISIICALFSNPLLFIQVSYPNAVGNVIDCFCISAPLLYVSLWMYYVHHLVKYDDESDGTAFLVAKMVPCVLLYFLEVLRLMHFEVLLWESIIGVAAGGMVIWEIWEALLNIKHQHHRDKLLVSTTLFFIACLLFFARQAQSWAFLMQYVVIQSYGLFLLYLVGHKSGPKLKKNRKLNKMEEGSSLSQSAKSQSETNMFAMKEQIHDGP